MSGKENKKAVSLEEAQAVIKENEIAKQQACADEVNAVLKKHGYALDITKPQLMLIPAQ